MIRENINKFKWPLLVVLAVAVIFTFNILHRLAGSGFVHVYFLDVGQGDAIFIKTISGNQILIDGGPGSTSVINQLGKVMPFWDRSIDMLVLTHPDSDHLNGLLEVIERYKVDQVIGTGLDCKTSQCVLWERLIEEENASQRSVWLGDIIDAGDGVFFEVLYPFESIEDKRVSKVNNSSLVIKMIYGEHELLLTGDIEAQTEYKLAFAGLDVGADFLKVAHHGSKTSSVEEFIAAVDPELAFINVGRKNRYGHPSEQVLRRLEDNGIKYYRTDTDGLVELILDGQNYQVITY